MERNYDEGIADMLIQLANMEVRLERENERLQKENTRLDLTIKRMVKAESRLKLFDLKLEQSIKAQQEFFEMQSRVNTYFLGHIKS